MLSSAVVDQRAKLGVSAEESKAQRLKRQQARFRDRGGAFVPSTSNPLVDILLARTVSGESPSKPRPRRVVAKRPSISKPRRSSPTCKAGTATATQTVIRNSNSKAAPRKKAKAVELQVDPRSKPVSKRRGRPAQNNKVQGTSPFQAFILHQAGPDHDTEQPPLANTNTPKLTSKGKGKQRAAPSTSDGYSKPKAKRKSSSAAKALEVLDSDDEQTLVEATYQVKSGSKRRIALEDDDDTDDAPVLRKRVVHHVDDSRASGTRTATRVKAGRCVDTGNSVKKTSQDKETTQDEKRSEITAKKQSISSDSQEGVAALPAKKVASLMPAKPIKPEHEPYPTTDVINMTGQDSRTEPVQDVIKHAESDNDGRPLERVSKPKKRKKEEDNNDDQPRKAVRFSESGPPSQKLKENQKRRRRLTKSSTKDGLDAPYTKLVTKLPTRAKTRKGPPREVLERIKASAAQHLRCVDNEPDELDCLP